MRWARSLAIVLCLGTSVAFADDTPQDIVKRVDDKPGDAAVAQQGLTDIEAYVAGHPTDALGEYAHGMILSRLDRKADAVTAYDNAAHLDPTLADAFYNGGVLLLDLGKQDDAIKHFEKALKVDPKHVDAAYNLGQVRYNRKEYAKALAAWKTARKIAPDDFGAAKKVLQALNALGKTADAAKARDELIAMWKSSQDPAVQKLTQFVFDQFDASGWHVYAYETFDPKGDLYNVYTFTLADPKDIPQGSINVESSAVIREQGTPYVLGASRPDGSHKTLAQTWKKLPAYKALKPIVLKAIKSEFGAYKPPAAPTP